MRSWSAIASPRPLPWPARPNGYWARHCGTPAVLDWKFDAADLMHTALHDESLDRKTFNDAENRVSNALRHFDSTDAPDFEADLEEAACWMLVAGLRECAPARGGRAGLRSVQRLVLRTRRQRLTGARPCEQPVLLPTGSA